jgi:hypothetical protein
MAIDEQRNDSWDQTVNEHNTMNEKDIVDRWAAVSHNKAVANANLQDQINSQFLRWADDAHGVANLVANNSAVLANRANNLATTWDNLVIGGEVDTTAQGKMAADLARSVANEAVQQALAMTAQTAPPAQGTTGVAQGAMQMGGGVATAAILAQIAKLAEAVNVLYIKVLGEEATAEKP